MRLGTILLGTVVALALLPGPSAQAKTTIGSSTVDVDADAVGGLRCGAPSCRLDLVQDVVDGTPVATPRGVIVAFRWQSTGAVSLVVYRPSARAPAPFAGDRVAITTPVDGDGPGVASQATTRIPVQDGDAIGLALAGSTIIHDLVAPAGDPVLAVGQPDDSGAFGGLTTETDEIVLQADVEPDADGDGFGDETQDDCPGDATTQGACPTPPPAQTPPAPPPAAAVAPPPAAAPAPTPPPAAAPAAPKLLSAGLATRTIGATRRGVASIALSNPNAFGVRATFSVRRRGRAVGSGRVTLAAGEVRIVNVKLVRAARPRHRRDVKLELALRTTGPAGTRPVTVRLNVTVRRGKTKLPRRPGAGSTPGTAAPAPAPATGAPAAPSTQGALDGQYDRAPDAVGPTIRFRVTNAGRRIEMFRGTIVGLCVTFGAPSMTQTFGVSVDAMDVAPDGSFGGTQVVQTTTITVTDGKLDARGATGRVSVKIGNCNASAVFASAKVS